MRARCPFCGKVYEADTRARLADLAARHLLLPGPCSDKMMRQVVDGRRSVRRVRREAKRTG